MSPEYRLTPYPVIMQLVFDEEEWLELCEQHGFKDLTYLEPLHMAVVETYGSLIVVKFSENITKMELPQRANTVAHEMAHVFQALCVYISETNPSQEFMAYTIGDLVEYTLKEIECLTSQDSGSTLELEPSSSVSLESTSSTTSEQSSN